MPLKTKLQSSYNCVLACAYNVLMHHVKVSFPFACLCLTPKFFKLEHLPHEPLLLSEHPEQAMVRLLSRIGAEAVYPDIGSPDHASAYADTYLAQHAVLPFFINLRYSALDPAPIDNDYWNMQLLLGRDASSGQFLAFDTFHGKDYPLDAERFRLMIDTPFNYRTREGFAPFLTIVVHDPEESRSELARMTMLASLAEAAADYPLESNLEAGHSYVTLLRKLYLHDDGRNLHNEIYKIIGFQRILIKQREQIGDFAEMVGYPNAQRFDELAKAWDAFSYGIAMAISRHERDSFDRLSDEWEALIRREHRQVSELEKWLKPSRG
ncbi:hypothetical protein XYCOK13_16860 [Xylanibacillus composti]|uniref:Uncharacterized protein n=2 Tax=Xylanibacillus composti TaxID=1572762 RepID=A0A8J4H3L6_9BACL|nr:hypothetical protein XYCOK13_16860 [Xylanibacillus composti]